MYKRFALSLSALLLSAAAFSATEDTTFLVSITVENSCTISVNDLNFGTVNDLTPSISASTTGTVTCTGLAPVSVSFDAGTGGASTFATRQMDDGVNTIDYNLYRDAANTEILGDGSGGTFTIDFTSTGGADAFDVYGLTDPGQNPKPAGTYNSTITATATF
ncbi:Csu type fimbrial protein [Microbulbifer thermotolerans]|nr:spore coat U domain-containing protein [Microbulbifer thermotolerans]MCX2780708.1 spore coat U domain-containing protein [Microbulbifer thermotolerans]MCX2783566.1 spore coat U domain-containing protein [Microbulbifer thermotolerans]MCX2795777.1 spore coat U domain-containing protein [Microbulbifer thermotolerans]MCX2801941.1 spore coat U domain-containing protein [Microbulbifer thermotolerans]MCX2806304.1 spore coat U domain-containing protein [Microbulbifer thermotolerans]